MMQDQVKDTRHRRIGWIASVSITLSILVLFYFLIAWKEPFPPNPSYGIELSFGIDNSGYGDLQVSSAESTPNEANTSPSDSENEGPEDTHEEIVDDSESDVVETVTGPEEMEVTEEQEPIQEEPVDQEEPNVQPDSKEEITSKEVVDQPETSGSKGTEEDTQGDQGKEEGTIDGRALMGGQGTTDGANLDLAGWTWDSPPRPKDQSAESGKIVYSIVIDEYGYIKRVDLISSTVSPVVERLYRQSVEKITFSQTTNTPAPPSSAGKITFIIRTK